MTQTPSEQSTEQLKQSIKNAIAAIAAGESTPVKSEIGKMFSRLSRLDKSSYDELVALYKPVSGDYHKLNPVSKKKTNIEREIDLVIMNLDLSDDDIDENGDVRQSVRDRVARDVKSRIEQKQKQHQRAPRQKRDPNEPRVRDRQSYRFNGQEYGKGPLVHAIVSEHAKTCNNHSDMKRAFPDELLRSYGIFKRVDGNADLEKMRKRYFLKDKQVINLSDCKIAVCNQFTSDNIKPFLNKAAELGYKVEV